MSDALSSRIRPNSEAAPWVVEEVRTIERELTAAISAEEDWHRWAREVLIDWNVQFDDHKAGLRLAMVQLIKDRSAALTAAIERAEKAEHELFEAKADAESWRQQAEMHMQTSLAQAERAEKAEIQVIGGGYAAQMLRKAVGLDNTKEDLHEVALLFDDLTKQRDHWREVAGMLANADTLLKHEDAIAAYDALIAKEKAGNNE